MAIIHDEEWLKNNKLKVLWFKTFGGLERGYYWSHFAIGASFYLFYLLIYWQHDKHDFIDKGYLLGAIGYGLVLIILYPYARFIFDVVWNFIIRLVIGGDAIFYSINTFFFIFKILRVMFCLLASPILTPFAIIYIYIYHTIGIRNYLKEQREQEREAAEYEEFLRWQESNEQAEFYDKSHQDFAQQSQGVDEQILYLDKPDSNKKSSKPSANKNPDSSNPSDEFL